MTMQNARDLILGGRAETDRDDDELFKPIEGRRGKTKIRNGFVGAGDEDDF